MANLRRASRRPTRKAAPYPLATRCALTVDRPFPGCAQVTRGSSASTAMSQGFPCPSFVTRTQSEPSYPTDVVFGKDRLGLRYAVLTQQHMEGGSESVSPFGDSARGGESSARCTECSSQADPADLPGGVHSPLDQTSPQSSGRSMHDPFRDHAPAALAAGRHLAGSPHMFAGVEAPQDAGDLPTFEDIQRRLQAAISSQDAFGGRHPSSPPVFRTSSTVGGGFPAPISAARHRRSHSADGREMNKGLRVISHDLDLSAGTAAGVTPSGTWPIGFRALVTVLPYQRGKCCAVVEVHCLRPDSRRLCGCCSRCRESSPVRSFGRIRRGRRFWQPAAQYGVRFARLAHLASTEPHTRHNLCINTLRMCRCREDAWTALPGVSFLPGSCRPCSTSHRQ